MLRKQVSGWRGLATVLMLALAVAACGTPQAEPDEAAVKLAGRPGGVFLGGFRPDLGWRAGEVFVSDDGDCAAAALITDEGWGTVMILASLEHHEISDIYVGASPGRIRRLRDQVGELGWVPVPSPMDVYDDPDVNPYRLGQQVRPQLRRDVLGRLLDLLRPAAVIQSALGPLSPAGVLPVRSGASMALPIPRSEMR